MNPSDFPWWAWLVCGFVLWLIGNVVHEDLENSIGRWAFGWLIVLSGILVAFVGIVRFVKWIWVG